MLGRKRLREGWEQKRVAGGALCLETPTPCLSPQDEYEELDVIHKEEKLQLEELKRRHDVLVEEFSQIQAEQEINAKKRLEAEQEMVHMVRAATLIQALWKGYLVRSMLRSKKRKRSKSKVKEEKGKGKGKGKEKGKEKGKGKGKK